MTDLTVSDHGSIFILAAASEAGAAWLDACLPDDCPVWAGGFAIEHRYIGPIVDGALDDGLDVE